MIHTVIVTNYLGDKLTLDLRNPWESGLAITSITGIGESLATVNLGDYASGDGSFFSSSRALSRNIVIDFKFLHSPTIDEARHRSYKYFPIKKEVTLEFITKDRHSQIKGYVESNNAQIFSNSTGTSISIVCPAAFFNALLADVTVFYGETPMFHFPFSNTDLVKPTIQFGVVSHETEKYVSYDGEVETGMMLTLRAHGVVKNIVIYDTVTHNKMVVSTDVITAITGKGMGIGDEIIISTVSGNRYAKLLREGVYYNILNCIGRDSTWLTLTKGDNVFAYTASEGADDLMFKIEHRNLYEGV